MADVAFNADPRSGQYVAVMAPGAGSASWLSAGGTSLATPQWAGLLAVANAQRAMAGKAALGQPHATLYAQIASAAGSYAAAFADVSSGSHGSCTLCTAKTGYDQLTGLGTPNAASLLGQLAGATAVVVAPAVGSASLSASVGSAFSYQVAVNAANPVSHSLVAAPAGMAISSAGVLSWARPVAGSYSVTVKATDSKTGLSGQGVLTLTVTNPGPVITASTWTGVAGKPLSGRFSVASANGGTLSVAISGVPPGMGFTVSALVFTAQWPRPVTGNYRLAVRVTDAAGRSASATVPVVVTAR